MCIEDRWRTMFGQRSRLRASCGTGNTATSNTPRLGSSKLPVRPPDEYNEEKTGMELQKTDLGNACKIALQGRLDTPGVDQIETRFTASIVPSGKNALVDLSGVTFISSMGIRMLIAAARSLNLKKAKMILFGPQTLVKESLDHVSLNDVIPIVATEAEALELLKA
jgi:anti-sigma B factor antagonist